MAFSEMCEKTVGFWAEKVGTGLDLSARYCVKSFEHDFMDFNDEHDFVNGVQD